MFIPLVFIRYNPHHTSFFPLLPCYLSMNFPLLISLTGRKSSCPFSFHKIFLTFSRNTTTLFSMKAPLVAAYSFDIFFSIKYQVARFEIGDLRWEMGDEYQVSSIKIWDLCMEYGGLVSSIEYCVLCMECWGWGIVYWVVSGEYLAWWSLKCNR